MKTKIIYISGNEVFDMNDIRAAFEEVRLALNMDKSTVLFGVPVDEDDAGLMSKETSTETVKNSAITAPETVVERIKDETPEPITEEKIVATESEEIEKVAQEIIPEEKPKKRGRPRKEEVIEPVEEDVPETTEKIVPILSVLSNDEPDNQNIEIIPEISDETIEDITEIEDNDEEALADEDSDDTTSDLEKLLSEMTPLDITEDKNTNTNVVETTDENEDLSVDATLEQLATEFAESQDKIETENKSSTRSKIGKLRNILPFKASKHKDQNFGDLFSWGGTAANDEDYSVPGFFTNAAAKK